MLENSQSLHYFLVRKCIVKFMTFTSFLYPSFSPRPAAAAAASAAISFFLFQPLQTKIFGIEKCLPPFVVANLLLLFKLTVLILSLSIHLSSLSFSLSLSSTTVYLLSFSSFSLLYLQTLFSFFLSSLSSTTILLHSISFCLLYVQQLFFFVLPRRFALTSLVIPLCAFYGTSTTLSAVLSTSRVPPFCSSEQQRLIVAGLKPIIRSNTLGPNHQSKL